MKNLFLALLACCMLTQCQTLNSEVTPILFTIDHFDVPNNKMEVTFSITNTTNSLWEGGNWSLHWNSIFGETVPESLPEGMKYTYVNGQQYLILAFGEQYSLKPNENLSFSFTQKGIIPRLAMGPSGFFVRNEKTQTSTDLESKILWKNAKGIEDLKLPSAADRYKTYETLELLNKEELSWVIPSPQKQQFNGEYRTSSDLNIDLNDFDLDQDFIKKRLQEGLSISVSSNATKEINLRVIKNHALDAEAYTLEILENEIRIEASQPAGAFYAFESLHQILLIAQNEKKGWPLLTIEDAPRFQNRGFMSDVARNFYPKEKLFQILDYMALYKLNRFDLKLTDDDGWRIEIPGLPELTEIGAKRGYTLNEKDRLIPMYGSGSGNENSSGNGFLTGQDFIEIIQYAKQRNIEVIPQVSFPSHARAAIKAMEVRYEKYKANGNMEAAREYMLHDPKDQSEYRSAQLYKDNVVCICDDSAYRFYEKIVLEIKTLYDKANTKMKVFNIGADELPYGPWQKSPKCKDYIAKNKAIPSVKELYNYNLRILNSIITNAGARMVGWEDALLVHSENEQSELNIKEELLDLDFIPYVWNNSWGGGREDMIYRLANKGFKTIMSNSSAFYFDMVDDYDMENRGMSWSGYVSYLDTWGTEPLNVFANKVKLESLGIEETSLATKEFLKPEAEANFLGIQSQLWTETITSEEIFDGLFMPNLIVFSQRAWGAKEKWLEFPTAKEQKPALEKAWNLFVNTLGQRQLPLINELYGGIDFDLPKPGGIITEGELRINQQFPGLKVRYTLDGSEPNSESLLYIEKIKIPTQSKVRFRSFDSKNRGGKTISIH